jgi:G6PDH family F420-dependent oxidoreductase
MTIRIGYKLMSEEHGPRALVENACAAEEAGFDFVAISDHFAPWLEVQGHSPFAWSVLGAIAQATTRVGICTAVTCPSGRYHPAIVAQAAATVALLAEGRFTLGLGSGERLNEHVTGEVWPSVGVRQRIFAEAVEVIRLLLEGRERYFDGEFFDLEDARLFDLPENPPPLAIAAGGPQAAALAAEKADGLFATDPEPELVKAYREAGGSGPRYAEVPTCWGASRQEAIGIAHRFQRWGLLGWQVLPELPNPRAFEQASKHVRPEDVAAEIACGADVEAHLGAMRAYVDAGFDRLVLVQPGPEQKGFLDFFQRELGPAARKAFGDD